MTNNNSHHLSLISPLFCILNISLTPPPLISTTSALHNISHNSLFHSHPSYNVRDSYKSSLEVRKIAYPPPSNSNSADPKRSSNPYLDP